MKPGPKTAVKNESRNKQYYTDEENEVLRAANEYRVKHGIHYMSVLDVWKALKESGFRIEKR